MCQLFTNLFVLPIYQSWNWFLICCFLFWLLHPIQQVHLPTGGSLLNPQLPGIISSHGTPPSPTSMPLPSRPQPGMLSSQSTMRMVRGDVPPAVLALYEQGIAIMMMIALVLSNVETTTVSFNLASFRKNTCAGISTTTAARTMTTSATRSSCTRSLGEPVAPPPTPVPMVMVSARKTPIAKDLSSVEIKTAAFSMTTLVPAMTAVCIPPILSNQL